MKTIGGNIDSLLCEIRSVINEYSGELGSDFGIEEMIPPASLEEILPTIVITTVDGLSNILTTIRREILYDTGMVLDLLRKPLRTLQDAFHRLDLHQYLQHVEDEDSLRDWPQANKDDERCAIACEDVCKRIEYQMAQVHIQRKLFIKNLEEATGSYRQERLRMDEEIDEALKHLDILPETDKVEEYLVSVLSRKLMGRELHDFTNREIFFRRLRGFLWPIYGKRAFDVFDSLEECVEYAKLEYDMTNG